MTCLSLRLLGSFQIYLDGSHLTGFESDKERALLAYLAEESQKSHRREKLAGFLWPERTEAAARNNLRRVLSNLRRLLGDRSNSGAPILLVSDKTIRLNPACDAWIDSQAFAKLLEPSKYPSKIVLEEAILLYKGDFLEGFSVTGSPACEEWIVLCRERYQRVMMDALHRLVEIYESQGNYERAIQQAWRQLDLQPWWENAHQQLMRLLALSGRRSEALAQFGKCRDLLAEELGVTPSADTIELYQHIRDGELAGPMSYSISSTMPTHNLPLTDGPFLGREVEVAKIQGYLGDPACRLLTLVGAGGMGKTRLAVEAVTEWISDHKENPLEVVTLVVLTPQQTEESINATIAHAGGFQLSPGQPPGQQLLEILGKKRWLLILDSFEHMIDGAGLVTEILKSTSNVKVLATSRTRLNLQAENILHVTGIKFPEKTTHESLEIRNYAAIQLFLQAAHRTQPQFEADDEDLTAIARLCRLLEGMPLGILQAATWMNVLSPAEIVEEIDQNPDFLTVDWPDVPERQRSLGAVFDQSWNLLSQGEREVFQALSIFCGGFTRPAAEYISGASLLELKALMDKSLLEHEPSGRYHIHELLRHYTAGKLDLCPEARKAAGDRHCGYYCAALKRWEADLSGSRQQEALIEMKLESENIRAAWYWAVDHAQIDQLDQAMEGLEDFYWQSGRYLEAVNALHAAQAAATAAVHTTDDKAACLRVGARALAWQSNFLRAMGNREAARDIQQNCLTMLNDPILAETDTRLEHAILFWSMGATICMEDYAQGRELFKESFHLFQDLDHARGTAWALNSWGTMSIFLFEFQDARQKLEEALCICQELGNQSGSAGSLSRLAGIACMEGHFEEAESLARQGYAASLESGSRTQTALVLLDLGNVLEYAAKFSEAHSVLEQSLALFNDLGNRNYSTQAYTFLGAIDMHMGCYQKAREYAERGLALAQTHGPRFCVGLSFFLLGCLDLAQGEYSNAYQNFLEAISVQREIGSQDDLSLALSGLAFAANGLGDLPGARFHLLDALEAAVESRTFHPLLWALPAMSLYLASSSEIELAVELYALSWNYPFIARSQWFVDVAGSRLADVTAALPPERVAVLLDRGQARDIESTVVELRDSFAR